jgi:hypothetical protein
MAKYDPLKQHLQGLRAVTIVLSFSEIERILGAPLPKSARDYREWWENEKPGGSHVQSKAWLSGGYSVDSVDFGRERVTFKRN